MVSEIGSLPFGLDLKSGPAIHAASPLRMTKVEAAPSAAQTQIVAERRGATTGGGEVPTYVVGGAAVFTGNPPVF